jgi:toxin ParE1/3/4
VLLLVLSLGAGFLEGGARLCQPLPGDAETSDAALKWYRGLKEAVLSLEELPNRCPMTPEKAQLRHLLYGNKPHVYRAIFRVVEKHKRVDGLSIRHDAKFSRS